MMVSLVYVGRCRPMTGEVAGREWRAGCSMRCCTVSIVLLGLLETCEPRSRGLVRTELGKTEMHST